MYRVLQVYQSDSAKYTRACNVYTDAAVKNSVPRSTTRRSPPLQVPRPTSTGSTTSTKRLHYTRSCNIYIMYSQTESLVWPGREQRALKHPYVVRRLSLSSRCPYLTGDTICLRYEPNRLMLSIGLWRWYINMTITILDIIHRPVFYLKLNSTL
jgi:hypothetical protein